jgi:hypothetical protein
MSIEALLLDKMDATIFFWSRLFAIALLFAFLAGGVILNVLKEELPEERQSRFWAFALGAGIYTVLLLAL